MNEYKKSKELKKQGFSPLCDVALIISIDNFRLIMSAAGVAEVGR